MLELRNTKIYSPNKTIFSCSELIFSEGDFVLILGPSGAGKSTLLNYIAGFIPYEGRHYLSIGASRSLRAKGIVLKRGLDISEMPAEKRNYSVLYQSNSVYPHMSVLKNITAPMREERDDKHVLKARQLASKVKLNPSLFHRKAGTLSGGEQQRVGIAKLLGKKSDILLLDEPFSHLDPLLKDDLRKVLRDSIPVDKVVVLMVSHDWSDLKYANKALIVTPHDEQSNQNAIIFDLSALSEESHSNSTLSMSSSQSQWVEQLVCRIKSYRC